MFALNDATTNMLAVATAVAGQVAPRLQIGFARGGSAASVVLVATVPSAGLGAELRAGVVGVDRVGAFGLVRAG